MSTMLSVNNRREHISIGIEMEKMWREVRSGSATKDFIAA